MNISDIRIKRFENSKMVAIASVVFDNVFVVHDIKIIRGEKGLFIAMPSRQNDKGEFRDTCHPIVTEFRDMLSKAILEKFETLEGNVSKTILEKFETIDDDDDDDSYESWLKENKKVDVL